MLKYFQVHYRQVLQLAILAENSQFLELQLIKYSPLSVVIITYI